MRYFLASYYQKPGGKYNESVKVDTKVRIKDLQAASVIIDYKERKIVKSSFRGELGADKSHDFNTINNFYKQHYSSLISQLEAKYEVLNAALEMASEIVNDDKVDEVAATIESIAKADDAK